MRRSHSYLVLQAQGCGMTIIVNLFAGPGTGKSTTAALTFGALKQAGVNCELAHEWAKEAAWEKRSAPLFFQPYVVGKQAYRVHRLIGECEVVITDSPILFSLVYGDKTNLTSFEPFVVELFKSWDTLNFFLERDSIHHPYNPKGRFQTEDEALILDAKIQHTLDRCKIDYEKIRVSVDTSATITDRILARLSAT